MAATKQLRNLATKKQSGVKTPNQVVIVKNADGQIDLTNAKKMPKRIQFVCDNTSGTDTGYFRLFDACGIVQDVVPLNKPLKPQSKPVLTQHILRYLNSRTIKIDKVRMQVTKSADQFNNKATVYDANIEGTVSSQPMYLEDAVSSDDFDPKIQTYKTDLEVSCGTAIDIPVNKGEKLTVTFYIADVINK